MKCRLNVLVAICALLTLIAIAAFTGCNSGGWTLLGYARVAEWGQFGDFIGGVVGTVATFMAAYFAYGAYTLQKDAAKDAAANLAAEKRRALKNEIEGRFIKMIGLHRQNVSEVRFPCKDGDNLIWRGRDAFTEYEKCLRFFYETTSYAAKQNASPTPRTESILNLSYEYFFRGLKPHSYQQASIAAFKSNKPNLNEYKVDVVRFEFKAVVDEHVASRKRDHYSEYHHIDWSKHSGFVNELGHYYTHLLQTIKYINEQTVLTYQEKYEYVNLLRSQLSSSEQVLLFFRSFHFSGDEWEFKHFPNDVLKHGIGILVVPDTNSNKRLITKYRLIYDIPSMVFDVIDPLQFYPDLDFDFCTTHRREQIQATRSRLGFS